MVATLEIPRTKKVWPVEDPVLPAAADDTSPGTAELPAKTDAGQVVDADNPVVFTKDDYAAFRRDDAAAGKAIARIMTTLFTYSVFIMLVVLAWTISVVR